MDQALPATAPKCRGQPDLLVHGIAHAARRYSLITPPSTSQRCTNVYVARDLVVRELAVAELARDAARHGQAGLGVYYFAVAYWVNTHSAQFGAQMPTRSPLAIPRSSRPRARASISAASSA